jgi:hypothetical protein
MRLRHVSYKGVQFYVPDEEATEGVVAADVGMQHWFNDSLKSTLTYAEQVWWVNRSVQDNLLRVLEVFCGFGMSTATLDSFRIIEHVAFDMDLGCVTAFKHLRPDAKVFEGDSYYMTPLAVEFQQFDYVLLEHNAMTTYKAMREPRERALMDAVFNSRARYVVFVDSAKVKVHLHYQTYSKFFGMTVTNSGEYLQAVDRYFRATYGYHIKSCAHDSINYTILLECSTAPVDSFDIMDTRDLVNMKFFKDLGYIDVDV